MSLARPVGRPRSMRSLAARSALLGGMLLASPFIVVLAFHNLGSIYEYRDAYAQAAAMNRRSVAVADVLGLPTPWQVGLRDAIEREDAAQRLIDGGARTLLVREDFEKPGTLGTVDGASSIGARWLFLNGGEFVAENGVGRWAAGSSTESFAVVETGLADVEVEVTLVAYAPNARLAFRYSGPDNGLFVEAVPTRYQMIAIERGAPRFLAACPVKPQSGDRLAIRASRSSIRFAANGTECARTRLSFNQTATLHGFGARDAQARFDDWQVAVASPPRLWRKGV